MIKYSRFVNDPDYDIIAYGEALEGDQYLTFDREILEQAYNDLKCKGKVCERLALQTMIYRTAGTLRFLNQPSIYDYLTIYEGCPENYFILKGRKSISLDAKKVLGKLAALNYAPEFLDYYMKYKSYNAMASKIASVLACDEKVGVNKFGRDLYKLPYTVNVQQNLRFNYKDYDVISQIPKQYTTAYSVPEGYCLAWGDFAQSDWRIAYNLFIRSEENDRIMNMYDDKYEALARLLAMNGGFAFDPENFKEARSVYKVNTLATIYGLRASVIPEDNQFIKMFTKFLFASPRYMDYVTRIQDKSKLGLGINVRSYFGYEQLIPSMYETAMLDKCLNTPVQTCTSEIMILTVNKIIRMFRELGYDRDAFRVFMCRHDEPIFIMREDVLKDAWIFKEFEKIYVDDWTPLELQFNYGYSYKVPDEGLQNVVENVQHINASKIHFVTADQDIQNDFYPITETMKLFVDWHTVDEDSIVTLYCQNEGCAHNMVVHSMDPETVELNIKTTVRNIAKRLSLDEYEGIVVRGKITDAKDSFAGQFISYQNDGSPNVQNVQALATYTVCCYCKSTGKECPVERPDEFFEELIKSTKRWGILDAEQDR